MADDTIELPELNQDASRGQSPHSRAYMELFSTAPRKKPEDIMTYYGRALHMREPDMTMRQSYEEARRQYAYNYWRKEERAQQNWLYREVAGYQDPRFMTARQVNQLHHPGTLSSATIVPDTQQPTFYRTLAQAPVLIARGTNPTHSTESPQQVPVQNSVTPQRVQDRPRGGTLGVGTGPVHHVHRQAGQEAVQPAPHPVATQAAHLASPSQRIPAQIVPRQPLTPNKLRSANAVEPTTVVTDARAKILQMLQDKARRETIGSMRNTTASINRPTTSLTSEIGRPNTTTDLKKRTSEAVAITPVGSAAQTTSQTNPPPLVPLMGSAAIDGNHKTHFDKEQSKYGEQEDEDSDIFDATSLSNHQVKPTQSQTSADSPGLSDIIGSETPSEASEDSDTEYTPGDRSRPQSTIAPASQDRPRGRRASLRTTAWQQDGA